MDRLSKSYSTRSITLCPNTVRIESVRFRASSSVVPSLSLKIVCSFLCGLTRGRFL